ncbi:MAG: hypothetical protein AAF726_02955 [Planctomycetota bacterium]
MKRAAITSLCLALGAACSSPNERPTNPEPAAAGNQSGPTVVVRDEAGGPVPGAEVWIVDRLQLRAEEAVLASRMTGDWVETSLLLAAQNELTDAAGAARFGETPQSGVLVAARSGALFGGVELGAVRRNEVIEISVRPRPTYRVRVLDPSGAPVVGVPMSLGIPREDRGAERLAATSLTDSSGLAVIYEPPAAAFPARGRRSLSTARVAVARIATRDSVRVAVDEVTTAELALPPTASVAIEARHPWFGPAHWGGVVQLFAASDGSRSEVTLASEIIGGRALVQHVEIGVDLRVVAVLSEAGDGDARRFVGTHTQKLEPVETPGELVDRVLELGGGAFFAGRIVDASGEPLAGQPVDVRIARRPSTSWTVVTDELGAFRWLLTNAPDGLENAEIELSTRTSSALSLVPAQASASTRDLGTIELR